MQTERGNVTRYFTLLRRAGSGSHAKIKTERQIWSKVLTAGAAVTATNSKFTIFNTVSQQVRAEALIHGTALQITQAGHINFKIFLR